MILAFDWQTFGAGVIAGIIALGAVLGALGQIGRAVRGVCAFLKPHPPNVTLYGPGASTPRTRDPETGWVQWGEVVPSFKIENNEPHGIYDLTTGVERPSTGERETFTVTLPAIPPHSNHPVRQDDAFIPPEWLDGYVGEEPQKQVRYWVRFLDHSRRRWELLHDPQDLPPRLRRIRH